MQYYLYPFICAFLLSQACLANDNTPIAFLKKLVEIESGTAQVAAVNQVQNVLGEHLVAMGFKILFKTNPLGSEKSGKLLVATLAGEKSQFITLILHADTVFEPKMGFKDFKLSDDGQTAKGPGVIDEKGGAVIVLGGLEGYLRKHPHPLYSLRVIVSPSEETGSEGFLEEFKKLSEDTYLALGFEPALDEHTIVDSRQGNRWYQIKVTGREAHAGRAHKEGINACLDLSQKLYLMSQLTDYRKNVTVSIGHMEGGKDKFNIVCGTAEAKVDVRFSEPQIRDEVDLKIQAILTKPLVRAISDRKATVTEFSIANNCPPFSPSSKSKPLVEKYRRAINKIEKIEINSTKSGGSADSNYFAQSDVLVIDGLGAIGGKMHTTDEFIVLSSLETRAKALEEFLGEVK